MAVKRYIEKKQSSSMNLTAFLLLYCQLPTAYCQLFLTAFHRVSGVLPGHCAAEEGCCVGDSFFFECLHRTGARVLARSRAVGDDQLVAWKLIDAVGDLVGRDVD